MNVYNQHICQDRHGNQCQCVGQEFLYSGALLARGSGSSGDSNGDSSSSCSSSCIDSVGASRGQCTSRISTNHLVI